MRRFLMFAAIGLVGWLGWTRPWRTPVQPSSRLDELLPDAEFRDTISTPVDAPPEAIFRALREVTLKDMPLATAVGEIRVLPSRLAGKTVPAAPEVPFLEVVEAESGSTILAEEPGRELVVGTIGRLHDPVDQAFVRLADVEAFTAYAEPDHEKLAMSIRVEPDVLGTSRLILEHRTKPTDDAARRKFAAYWLMIKPGGAFVSYQLLRAVRRRAEAISGTQAAA